MKNMLKAIIALTAILVATRAKCKPVRKTCKVNSQVKIINLNVVDLTAGPFQVQSKLQT